MRQDIDRRKLLEKPDALQELLRIDTYVFVHVDTRVAGVVLPEHQLGKPQVVLQLGLNMAVPLNDLIINEEGVNVTLSFNRQPFFCTVPWNAVYLIVGDSGWGASWDPPPEIQLHTEPAVGSDTKFASQNEDETKKRTLPPGWKVIDGGK